MSEADRTESAGIGTEDFEAYVETRAKLLRETKSAQGTMSMMGLT